jgi:fumarate hydratase class I
MAQIDLTATEGMEYQFLLSPRAAAGEQDLYQETKALLNPASLEKFLTEKMKTLGTAGCPPYHLVFVVGGTSAEACLKTVKLGTTGYLDHLPTSGNTHGRAFRDLEMEEKMLQAAYKSGYGAQFGGKYFALDVRVIRLPRHGASCPVGMGVSVPLTAISRRRSTGTGFGWKTWSANRAGIFLKSIAARLRAMWLRSISIDR